MDWRRRLAWSFNPAFGALQLPANIKAEAPVLHSISASPSILAVVVLDASDNEVVADLAANRGRRAR